MSAKNQIEKLIAEEKWPEARQVVEERLRREPDNHWLLARLSAISYEQHNYDEALALIEKARELAPHCPLVLWDYAGALDMLGRKEEAVAVYRGLINRGVKSIAEDECGEGVDWAMGLLADCTFRLGGCYEDLGDKPSAAVAYRAYLAATNFDIPSIYTQEMAKERLHRLVRKRTAVEQELRWADERWAAAAE